MIAHRRMIARSRRGGTDASRWAAAQWLRKVRGVVRSAGNRIEPVHRGLTYTTIDADGRGLAYFAFSPFDGRMRQQDIADIVARNP